MILLEENYCTDTRKCFCIDPEPPLNQTGHEWIHWGRNDTACEQLAIKISWELPGEMYSLCTWPDREAHEGNVFSVDI